MRKNGRGQEERNSATKVWHGTFVRAPPNWIAVFKAKLTDLYMQFILACTNELEDDWSSNIIFTLQLQVIKNLPFD